MTALPSISNAALPIVAGPMGLVASGTDEQGSITPAKLGVPEEFQRRLKKSIAEGYKDSKNFAQIHTPASKWRIGQWAILKAPFAPKSDEQDLKELHAIAASRTASGVARAQYWSSHGLDSAWQSLLEQYKAKVSPAEAKLAQALFDDVSMTVNEATQIVKARDLRKRPYEVDTTLELVVDKPGNNPSHVSGHTTAAYGAAMVLSYLMPDRKGEFMSMAQEASWSRLYAGVHFPTDVLDGARLATTVTSYLTKISHVKQVRGTKPATDSDSKENTETVEMKALPMGNRIPGEPLPGAVELVRT